MEVKIRTLTPLWTGDVDRKCETLKETGIIGSLRWWHEALVRGLGGYACDPTSNEKCKLDHKKFDNSIKKGKSVQEALDEQICSVCQLFGCTGWKRRFGIQINGLTSTDFRESGQKAGLKEKRTFHLDILPLSNIDHNQKWLFKKTLLKIENYGAIGGRTTRKPGSYQGTSYGLIQIKNYRELESWNNESNIENVKDWLKSNKKNLNKNNNFNWFDFRFYWLIKGEHLDKDHMNNLLRLEKRGKRSFPKSGTEKDEFLNFLRGKQGVSKKIFSFDKSFENIEAFIFGYVRNKEELNKLKGMLRIELGEYMDFKVGKIIMRDLE